MTRGSCLCGSVRWTYDAAFDRMRHCHCEMCRKQHGSAFATFAGGPAGPLRFDSGEDLVVDYESSPGFHRPFCGRCGSVVPAPRPEGRTGIPAGNLEGDPGIRPSEHIYVSWKAPWDGIADGLPCHDHYPGFDSPRVDRESRASGTGGAVGGSCLCGAVAYEVTGPFLRAQYCHCSRCRRARGAAYGANASTALDDVTFTRGGDTVRVFRLPEARWFGQAFCPVCGSALPRFDPDRGENGIAIVPLGSLDDDPRIVIENRVYVGSKAPWYEIADGLPRFAEAAPQ